MKIGVISTSVFKLPVRGYSGLEHLAWLQAKGLAEKGHQVTLFAPDGSECPNVTVFPIGPEGQWDEKSTYSKYWKELLNLDVIIDNTWNKWSYILKQEGKLKAPVLGVLHAPVQTMYTQPPPVEKPCLVCISKDQSYTCTAHLHTACRVAYNGVDPDFYKPMGLTRNNRYLFLARFSTIKGPDIAINVISKTEYGMDMVGDTTITNEPQFFEDCRKKCDGNKIKMVGPANRSECVWHFSQSKGLLHPNKRFQEPFGLSIIEAQMCESPVIAWRNGSLREVILDGETGFLVESEDQMVNLIKSNAIKHINRKGCREWAASCFSLNGMINRYEELCKEAIDNPW